MKLSLQSGEVRKSGLRIRVQQQPIKLLEILLERPGEVVTREELRSRVWPDESFGDFDQALNIAVAKLRSALGDSAENSRFIETLPKRGYRFIADVSVVDADARRKRSESVGGDLPPTEPAHKRQAAELAVAPERRLWPARRVIVGMALVVSLPPGDRRGPEIRPSLFWLSRYLCFVGRLAVCSDTRQGSIPQSEGCCDQGSGIGTQCSSSFRRCLSGMEDALMDCRWAYYKARAQRYRHP
jgi:DNA-binding winged helix-turn-helix (wHTH) protein